MAKDMFNRYIWLVDTIYRAKKITFEEINKRWLRTDMSEGEDIPLRTFHNHRKAIEEIFDINIECNRQDDYKYYIENREDIEFGGIRNWLLNTFAINNLINESHKLKKRIQFEDIPSGQKYLTEIIEAMRDGLAVKITYQSYWRDEPRTFTIEPYFVKVFKQRWYVIAYSPGMDKLLIYALDRIQHLFTTETQYSYPKDFDPETYFCHCFGIINDRESEPCTIKLKLSNIQAKYLQSLPLHHSQEEVEKTEEFTNFKFFLKPSFDFRQEILSLGAEVEVLEPEWLREEIGEVIRNMCKRYK